MSIVLLACLALAPAALAQSAGDDEYKDPFGGRPSATAAPSTGVVATAVPTAVPTVDPAIAAAAQAKAEKADKLHKRKAVQRHADALKRARARLAAQATPEPTVTAAPESSSTSKSDGSGGGTVLGIIVIAVVLLGGATFLVVRRRRGSDLEPGLDARQ